MAVPDFQTLMRPVLAALDSDEARSLSEVRETVAAALGVTDTDRLEMLPSGKQSTYDNRVAWAVTHMAQAGLLERPQRARYKLTERGQKVLATHPARVDTTVLIEFPEYIAFTTRKNSKNPKDPVVVVSQELSPSESIGAIVEDSYDSLAEELLDRILAQSPTFLETLSLKLLRAMGYGGREALMEHTGKPGDGGLDGLVRQDALGLDLVGVQAKRYAKDKSVMRPEMQAFVGALQGAQTSRGVFVTTATFSQGARAYAEGVPLRLKLIDGVELGRLLIRYNVGVQVRETFELKTIDEEAFEG
ncbi:winged helix-turn-helix domain-containing protein [Smaragdicoccus niigatensis]|uniref:winged helix-turn-helix domain-containing protein n=1 Tax=Smaragdicoccus niigatensis TaxID=359359 RepID=UPI000368D359|nr:winged helix-turn-helix domain-containing protein [Smaragdicoccus niigatensis]